ncbi:MAG: STAS domain-containing protein [Actinobacteria bacterium]|nr:STAS domain-containing protein [Actinomycetota bacterium]
MQGSELSVSREGSSALTVVAASGKVDAATSARFAHVLSGAAAEAEGSLLVDLDEVGFLDVKGYVALLNADRKMRERGGEVVIVCSRPTTRHIFTLLDPRGRLRLCP